MALRKFCSRKRTPSTPEGETPSEPAAKTQAVQTSENESQAASAPRTKEAHQS